MQKAAGKRNRQIHKATINKGGKRKLSQAPTYVHGCHLFDRIQMPDGRKGFIFRRRSSGSFDVRTLTPSARRRLMPDADAAKFFWFCAASRAESQRIRAMTNRRQRALLKPKPRLASPRLKPGALRRIR
jgi:hypothetical protein